MKHQYFGDVDDYIKYGLLRALAGAGLTVTACWMMTPDDPDPRDGRMRSSSSKILDAAFGLKNAPYS